VERGLSVSGNVKNVICRLGLYPASVHEAAAKMASVRSMDLSTATAVYNANPRHAGSHPLRFGKPFHAMATAYCVCILFEGGWSGG
jgi:hypothetical protein